MKVVSKAKLLLNVVGDLRSLADSVQAAAESMAGNESTSPPPETKETEQKTVTLEQVRAVLAEKSQAGFTAQVRELLNKHGAPKLSQIDPANYVALMADAEGLK